MIGSQTQRNMPTTDENSFDLQLFDNLNQESKYVHDSPQFQNMSIEKPNKNHVYLKDRLNFPAEKSGLL